jgi:phenylacetate-CoA ligase
MINNSLTKIIRHSQKSELFRKLYADCNINNFDELPILTRSELASCERDKVLTKKYNDRFISHRTSGSTGIPLNIFFTKIEYFYKDFDFLKCYLQSGLHPFDHVVALRDPIDMKSPNLFQKLGLFRHFYLNVFDSYESNIKRLVTKFKNKQIVLKGYPSDLYALSNYQEDFVINNISVKLIITDSEVLEDYMSCKFLDVFKAPILNTFASVECGLIAKKLYGFDEQFIVSSKVRVDIIPGENGYNRLILTKLGSYLMPIIKYEIGDYTLDEPGNDAKVINSIIGKYVSVLQHINGFPVSGHLIKQEISNNFPELIRFQVIQDDINSIVVKITPNASVNSISELSQKIKLKIQSILGPLNVLITVEDLMKPRSTRKFQVILNNIPMPK